MKQENNTNDKGYNAYQARLYTITDELALKTAFTERSIAEEYLLDYFKDEHEGVLYARAVIRTIDPNRISWIVPWSVDNPNALLIDEENTAIDSWRVNFYDIGDILIKSDKYNKPISKNHIMFDMMNMNAFYATISCREIGRKNYIISKTYRNKAFNLLLIQDEDAKALINDTSIPLEEKYKKLIEQDVEETKRINLSRQNEI